MARKGYQKISQREYARRLGISNEAVSKAVREGRIKKGWNKKENKIIVEHADNEFGFQFKSVDEGGINEPEINEQNISTQIEEPKITPKSSFLEISKAEKWYQTQIKKAESAKITGELVNKEAVFKSLFTYGQIVRTQLLAIPDRTIDNIMSSKTRTEAHTLLTNALYEALENLTNTEQLNFES